MHPPVTLQSLDKLAVELAAKLEARATAELPAHLRYLFAELPDTDYPLSTFGGTVATYCKGSLALVKCCNECEKWLILYAPAKMTLFSLDVLNELDPDDERSESTMRRYLWWCSIIDMTDGIRIDPENPRGLEYRNGVAEMLGLIVDGIVTKNYELVHKVLKGQTATESIDWKTFKSY